MNKKRVLVLSFLILFSSVSFAENSIKETIGNFFDKLISNTESVENNAENFSEETDPNQIREYRSSTMIALDEQIFSGTSATVGYLNKQYNNALNSYLESINYDSDTIFMLGNQYFLMRRIDRANKIFNLDDTDLKNVFASATTYRMMGRNVEALEKYNMAISINSAFAQNYLGRGLVYRNMEEYDAAIKDLKRYISMGSGPDGYIALGDIYFRLKKYDEAKKIVGSGLGKFPKEATLTQLYNAMNKNE